MASLSFPEVADLLQLSVKATYKLMARALDALRKSMLITIFTVFDIIFKLV